MLRLALKFWSVLIGVLIGALIGSAAAFAADDQARGVVDASAPTALSVTVYRDPSRGEYGAMDRDLPQGFAMISEQRIVTLPPGVTTIRFAGVAEGMVAVSAIVTGLPAGTIEKNRNADLLSPAALVDGTLGNKVRITRTNPGTGAQTSERATVRTRADGGLVLQTARGYEAVRCAGLPEKLTFDSIPDGLSAGPVFSIDTRDDSGGTYRITLTYLAWGFDWEANYVATLHERGGANGDVSLSLYSWLTLLNDNGQSFPDAQLLAVAGSLNVVSDFEDLSDPPRGKPLRLRCYPIGSTAAGSSIPRPMAPAMLAESGYATDDQVIIVTGTRRDGAVLEMAAPQKIMAGEENLGDLKLYRMPEPVTVSAQGLKQVAFLDQERVKGSFIYKSTCLPGTGSDDTPQPAMLMFKTKNDLKHGLGQALPTGGIAIFEPSSFGPLLIAEQRLRDHAISQDVEIDLVESTNVHAECARLGKAPDDDDDDDTHAWMPMQVKLSNANSRRVTVWLDIGAPGQWEYRTGRNKRFLKDGRYYIKVKVPANRTSTVKWKLRVPKPADDTDA